MQNELCEELFCFLLSNQIHKGSASEKIPNEKKEVNFSYTFIVDRSKQSPKCITFGRKEMSKKKVKFNLTQGITLLLLKKMSLPSNLVFQLILFITNPENNIGYED